MTSGISRIRFPEDEKKIPWLASLLEGYSIIDRGIAAALKKERKRGNVKLACMRGCSSCCRTHRDIPVYGPELAGIFWYCREKLQPEVKKAIQGRLARHGPEAPCPFLYADACSIHPLRPSACRQFNVFNSPCAPGEDPFFTRRQDVLTPVRDYARRAFALLLPFYGMNDPAFRTDDIIEEVINTRALNLQDYDWRALAESLKDLDNAS